MSVSGISSMVSFVLKVWDIKVIYVSKKKLDLISPKSSHLLTKVIVIRKESQ